MSALFVRQSSCTASRFLTMAREIAAGMEYLAHKAFIHRVHTL